jgi:RNA polymerase sigma-70 factor (ECF subfamily)
MEKAVATSIQTEIAIAGSGSGPRNRFAVGARVSIVRTRSDVPDRPSDGEHRLDALGCRPRHADAYCQPAMVRNADSSDEALMLDYRNGDVGAFDELYRRHKGGLYRYLLRQCRDPVAAAEMFQDIWMNLVRARGSYEATARFATYLYRLAHNRLVDHYRKTRREVHLAIEEEIAEPAVASHEQPHSRYERKQWAAHLLALLDALPEAQREAFVLQHESGMSVEEIAAATGVTRETAKSRLRYALAKLRLGMSEWR